MNKFASFVILIGGIVLLACGIHASDTFDEGFPWISSGPLTTRAACLLIGGFLTTLVGLAGALRSRES